MCKFQIDLKEWSLIFIQQNDYTQSEKTFQYSRRGCFFELRQHVAHT
jgi:hypothetical protein